MKYLVCQDWINTSGNHAGMLYLGKKMEELYPDEVKLFFIEDFRSKFRSRNRFLNFLKSRYALTLYKRQKRNIQSELAKCIKPGDEIILMEYLELLYPTNDLAYWIKEKFPAVKLSAFIHLVPEKLDKSFPQGILESWMHPIDRVITLGSSLTKYLQDRGIPAEKIQTSFHYVDEYYILHSVEEKPTNDRIKVLAMGNQMRNIKLLKDVVSANPNTDFIICQGVSDMLKDFEGLANVELIPYVSEEALRKYMMLSDISLNVMKDTIGSNVIVTSLGMGLAMICSDVGSIRDYCSEENTIFCSNNSKDFSNAIMELSKDRAKLVKMQMSAWATANRYSIVKFKNETIG